MSPAFQPLTLKKTRHAPSRPVDLTQWEEGKEEPKNWLLESKLDFGNVRPESGQVGLNGGSSRGAPALTIVSFDNWAICETADECTPDEILAVQATGKLPTVWGALKARY